MMKTAYRHQILRTSPARAGLALLLGIVVLAALPGPLTPGRGRRRPPRTPTGNRRSLSTPSSPPSCATIIPRASANR